MTEQNDEAAELEALQEQQHEDREAVDEERTTIDMGDPYPDFEFLTGRAGTGKTFTVRKRLEEAAPGAHVLCATTGIAAVNLGEGVLTLNSLLKFFDTQSLEDNWVSGFLEKTLRDQYLAGVERIVIDEVSMLDGKQLQLLCWAIDSINEWAEDHGNDAKLKLTLTGDFCQLPPVKAKFAFEVPEWDRFAANTTRLEKVWRQDDADFLHALNEARAGRGGNAIEFFRQFCWPHVEQKYSGTTLLSKNAEVDRYNRVRLSEVAGDEVSTESYRWGKTRSEWKNIPEKLQLRVGALVMVLANKKKPKDDELDDDEFLYVNGDLATVMDVGQVRDMHVYNEQGLQTIKVRDVFVRVHRTGEVIKIEPLTRDAKIPLEPGRRKELKEMGREHLVAEKYEVVGGVTYTPLRLAWATTVHKSQGLTLDEVQIDFRSHFYATGGMLYVALSRCRSAKGLRLVGKPETFVQRCSYNAKVKEWI